MLSHKLQQQIVKDILIKNYLIQLKMSRITSAAVVLSSTHGRERRKQRNISKRDLEAAVKYGKKEPAIFNARDGEQRWMYTFADIVYLTDSTSTREITSWPLECCGIDIKKKTITQEMYKQHEKDIEMLKNKSNWTSHVVTVVDQSGSMRRADTSDAATRSDVVWLTLALDYVAVRLESGECSSTDVLSILSMRDKGEILLKEHPVNWILYNYIIDLLRTQRPMGDGNYIPALDTAESLLRSNPYCNCALQLIFLSDGRPSDRVKKGTLLQYAGFNMIGKLTQLGKERVSKLASRFGRRLTVGAIAFGKPEDEDFSTLKGFAEAAKDYGSHGFFKSASLSVESLSEMFTTLSSTLTTTKVEMSEIGGSRQRKVRDVRREPISALGGEELDNAWLFFPFSSSEANKRSIVKTVWTKDGWKPVPIRFMFSSPDATGVALKKRFFGEGAERLVREFREVGKNGKFLGEPMVGKESRFIKDDKENLDSKEFHKVFCKTQKLAQRLARVFNRRMGNLPFLDAKKVPTISFLDCCVYMVEDAIRGRHGLLAEKMLDIKSYQYKKWNSNDGKVFKDDIIGDGIINGAEKSLDEIIEEDEEEEDDDDDDDWEEDSHEDEIKNYSAFNGPDSDFDLSDIPQVFSCFTYRYTRRKLIVCDLQGVLNTSVCPPVYEMTDPVIHYRSARHRQHVYGRTDKGLDGIHNFFRTHKHCKLCDLIHRKFVQNDAVKENEYDEDI